MGIQRKSPAQITLCLGRSLIADRCSLLAARRSSADFRDRFNPNLSGRQLLEAAGWRPLTVSSIVVVVVAAESLARPQAASGEGMSAMALAGAVAPAEAPFSSRPPI